MKNLLTMRSGEVQIPLFVAVLIFFTLLASAGCVNKRTNSEPTMAKTGAMFRQTLQHDGIERDYIVYLPTSYAIDTSLPLIIALHGYGGTATGFAMETSAGLNHYAEKEGFIAVYPQGSHFIAIDKTQKPMLVSSWNDLAGNQSASALGPMCSAESVQYPCPPECGDCGRCHWTACYDDLGFIKKMLSEIQSKFHINKNRQYLLGFSNGATMAHRLACEFDNEFAAVALSNGRLQRGYSCTPDEPMPLLQINGGLDTAVPADGSTSADGYFYTPSSIVAKQWAIQAQCNNPLRQWNNALSRNEGLNCNIYDDCNNPETEVISCIWPKGLHTWPGNMKGGGWCVDALQMDNIKQLPQCKKPAEENDVWGSELIWSFFEQHSK
ncbi:MAG: polyhydroxybutyrate depolymerase [Gammaproteobacteria bacterium]|jgi:polyhydroxybutyrate depolymerase